MVAIDLLDMPPLPGVDFLSSTFSTRRRRSALKALLGGPADVVMSDMAANATGHRKTDHLKIMALAEAAAMFAREVLGPAGRFSARCCKAAPKATLLADLKRDFATVKHVKPAASRPNRQSFTCSRPGFAAQRGRGMGTLDRT